MNKFNEYTHVELPFNSFKTITCLNIQINALKYRQF